MRRFGVSLNGWLNFEGVGMKKKSYVGWILKEDFDKNWCNWEGEVSLPDTLKKRKDDLIFYGLELCKVRVTFEIIGKQKIATEKI